MDLNVENLKELGAFAGGPVQKRVTWTSINDSGEEIENTAITYVRRASCATFEQEVKALSNNQEVIATRIASSICLKDGTPVFTYEQALELRDSLAEALFKLILEVNPPAPKNSPPTTKSSASSS